MNLSQRSTQSERMDTDCVDFDDYSRCLRDLSLVNIITMTHRTTLSWLARRATGNFSLLDVACGRGDAQHGDQPSPQGMLMGRVEECSSPAICTDKK